MSEPDPVEIVARALMNEAIGRGCAIPDVHPNWLAFAPEAQAALSTLKAQEMVVVPEVATEAMLLEGMRTDPALPPDEDYREDVAAIWQRMIAAALKEKA